MYVHIDTLRNTKSMASNLSGKSSIQTCARNNVIDPQNFTDWFLRRAYLSVINVLHNNT